MATSPVDDKVAAVTPHVTPEDVLQEVRFNERLQEVENKLPATLVLAKEGTLAKRNQTRRKLYRENELIRIEIEEKLNEYGIEQEWATSPVIATANNKLDAVRKQLKLDTVPSNGTIGEKVFMMARALTFVFIFIGVLAMLTCMIPLRALEPTMRKWNVPKYLLPANLTSLGYTFLLCTVAGTSVGVGGIEYVENVKDSVVCMFSHASNLDGFLVNLTCPIPFKYAGKKSLFMVPFVGWTARWGFGYVAIDRSNRKNATRSLKELAHAVNVRGDSVSISPEGTRSKDGLLQDFKKGPFYLRDDTQKNIVPAIVFGAYELWPPNRLFTLPGKTFVRYAPVFVPDPKKNRNQNRLALRRVMLDEFVKDIPDDVGRPATTNECIKVWFTIYLVWAVSLKIFFMMHSAANTLCVLLGMGTTTLVVLEVLVCIALEVLMYLTC